ncbi:hypothetical protein DLAC_02105 [Tieghemostelium lacteum]|uniref:Transmembrane protein n=1 Tax=Tieghemostelium lacteum TaxID=361077 RepID=A0A152A4N4_TIELA|nr:hypothetical protein DLAC_02105 [Tieghemostelium lacteum]|eukprot:KYR01021.1 hypothetical protein DLAC_02105 [Tieghemostelium lacteum]
MAFFETNSPTYNFAKIIPLISFILIILISLVAFNGTWFVFQAKVLTYSYNGTFVSTDYIEGVFRSLSFKINYKPNEDSSSYIESNVTCSYENSTQSQQESIYSSGDAVFTYFTCQYDSVQSENGTNMVKTYTVSSNVGLVIDASVVTISVFTVGSLLCCFLFPENKGRWQWFHYIKLLFSLTGCVILMLTMIEFRDTFPNDVAPHTATIDPISLKYGFSWYLTVTSSILFLISTIATIVCIITRPDHSDYIPMTSDQETVLINEP